MSVSRGVQFVPIGMPTICIKGLKIERLDVAIWLKFGDLRSSNNSFEFWRIHN